MTEGLNLLCGASMHHFTNMLYRSLFAVCFVVACICDRLYSGLVVQLQQGDCTDAADVLKVFSLCIL